MVISPSTLILALPHVSHVDHRSTCDYPERRKGPPSMPTKRVGESDTYLELGRPGTPCLFGNLFDATDGRLPRVAKVKKVAEFLVHLRYRLPKGLGDR